VAVGVVAVVAVYVVAVGVVAVGVVAVGVELHRCLFVHLTRACLDSVGIHGQGGGYWYRVQL